MTSKTGYWVPVLDFWPPTSSCQMGAEVVEAAEATVVEATGAAAVAVGLLLFVASHALRSNASKINLLCLKNTKT